MIMVYNLLH